MTVGACDGTCRGMDAYCGDMPPNISKNLAYDSHTGICMSYARHIVVMQYDGHMPGMTNPFFGFHFALLSSPEAHSWAVVWDAG